MIGETEQLSKDGLTMSASAWIAGLGLLAMSILGPIAMFYLLPMGIVDGDGAGTLQALKDNGVAFLSGGALLLVVYVLDVVVAWGLYWFLRPSQTALSQLAAWLRVLYVTFAFVGLIAQAQNFQLANTDELLQNLSIQALESEILLNLVRAETISAIAFLVFGAHLIVLGVAVWRARYVPAWIGAILVLAGASYLLMNGGRFIATETNLDWVIPFALGEAFFMAWLLVQSARHAFRPPPNSSKKLKYGYSS